MYSMFFVLPNARTRLKKVRIIINKLYPLNGIDYGL